MNAARIAKQLADHREALAQGQRSGRIRMAQIVECVLWSTKSWDTEGARATAKSGEKVMQAQPCPAVEFTTFRYEDRVSTGVFDTAITH